MTLILSVQISRNGSRAEKSEMASGDGRNGEPQAQAIRNTIITETVMSGIKQET